MTTTYRRQFMGSAMALGFGLNLASNAIAQDDSGLRGGDRISGRKLASRSMVWGQSGAVATAHPLASLIGIDILRQGGSAADAAIAINAALGFLEPTACGIGGDAFFLLNNPKSGAIEGFNGSGRSPAHQSLRQFQNKLGNKTLVPSFGVASVSLPGCVDAWVKLHAAHGKLPWARLFDQVRHWAKAGVPMVQAISYYLNRNVSRLLQDAMGIEETQNLRATFAPNGRTASEGEIFKNPDLARTYGLIAEQGGRSFYEGELAHRMVAYLKKWGSAFDLNDFKSHHGHFVTPLKTHYQGAEIYGLGPNTQGLSTLQILGIMRDFDIKGMGFQSVAATHIMVEAKRLAFEDRARYFADPDFAKTPSELLLSDAYLSQAAQRIKMDKVLTAPPFIDAPHHGDTTTFSVADSDGMMISFIQSNYRGMGSGLVPDGLGFMFQNRGELFSLKAGAPNAYGPAKRPFHTIIPGFATKDNKPWLAFAVMGGGMQPQGQAQIISNMLDHGLNLQEAGDAPRFNHDGSSEPTGEAANGIGKVHLESGWPKDTIKGLEALGHKIGPSDGSFGGYQAIMRGETSYAAATEMRKDGLALSY